MIGPLTYLDLALIAVAFISALLAMYRGLTRELLSILSWAVGAAIGLYLYFARPEFGADIARSTGLPPQIAQIIVAFVAGLIALIVVHLVTARISDVILESRVGMVDRVLGFLFGLARGFVLIVIPYMFYESFFPDPNTHLPWIKDSASLPYIKSTGNTFKTVLLNYLPSSLTEPPPPPPAGAQQGFAFPQDKPLFALAPMGASHISVTWRA